MKTNKTPPHTINQGSIVGDGSGNTINNGSRGWVTIGIVIAFVIAIIIISVVALLITNKQDQPKPSLAYHFLVDVSENMNQTINGVSQYEIAKRAVQNISGFGAFGTSRTWRGLRLVGGGDSCHQTSLIASGVNIPTDSFTQSLETISPSGINAYKSGLNASFEDMVSVESDIKIVFILMGSLDAKPCESFSFPAMLRSYIALANITPIICTFAIVDDLEFDEFKQQMINDGFRCVHQAKNADEISTIAIELIKDAIIRSQYIEEPIIPPAPLTELVYLATTTQLDTSVLVTDTPAPTLTPMPTLTPIPTLTPTPDATATLLAFRPQTNDEWIPIEREFDGVPMVLVPAGCFMMGSETGRDNEIPIHEQCFEEPFWIDKYEVTQAQFTNFGGFKIKSNAFVGDGRPVDNIAWYEANTYCSLRGGRLPTEAEWEYAARGVEGWNYPWGNDLDVKFAIWNRNNTQGTEIVGSIPEGETWVGALDMSGNVWEWTSSRGIGSLDRIIRGRSWGDYTIHGHIYSAFRDSINPNSTLDSFGVRCARSY